MKYKMLVLDLDGTLTNNKKEIMPKTKEAIIEVQKHGVRIVLASGRPTYGIIALANELQLSANNGYILAFNGGRIIDCTNNEVIFEQKLKESIVPELYRNAVDANLAILTYQGKGIATTQKDNKYVLHEAFINKMPVMQYNNFLSQLVYPINKCLIVGDPEPLHKLELKLSEQMKDNISVYRSADFFLECVPLGIDKAHSLDILIKKTNIKREEIIACGDGYNDLSMIKFAGLGVAMANATDDVKNEADFVTYSNEDDGIANVIEKFLQ